MLGKLLKTAVISSFIVVGALLITKNYIFPGTLLAFLGTLGFTLDRLSLSKG